MPTYEYRCPDGHDFEQFVQKISLASSELSCPVCGKAAGRRISAGGGFVFKGSGFYITDYGKDGKKDQRDKAAADTKSETTKKADAAAATTSSSESSGASAPSTSGEKAALPAPKESKTAPSKSVPPDKKAGGSD